MIPLNFSSKYIYITLHILVWSIVLLLPFLVGSSENNYRIGNIPALLFMSTGIIHVIIFYGNAFYLYPKLFNGHFWWLYILASFVLIGFSFRLKYFLLTVYFPETSINFNSYRLLFAPSILVYIVSLAYRIILNKIHFEKLEKERLATQLQAELKFLRSQISPHFLFNVLTNLVSLARKKSDRLEESLIMLSGMMRYMLYDTQGKKVALDKEIEYLKYYIELQTLRFGREVEINTDFNWDITERNYEIEPMLLIPFVENAFKHGVSHLSDPQINMKLLVKDDTLFFKVWNKYDTPKDTDHEDHHGIGLENIRQRLDLLYKGKYMLETNASDNLFHINLKLLLI